MLLLLEYLPFQTRVCCWCHKVFKQSACGQYLHTWNLYSIAPPWIYNQHQVGSISISCQTAHNQIMHHKPSTKSVIKPLVHLKATSSFHRGDDVNHASAHPFLHLSTGSGFWSLLLKSQFKIVQSIQGQLRILMQPYGCNTPKALHILFSCVHSSRFNVIYYDLPFSWRCKLSASISQTSFSRGTIRDLG